MNFKNVLLEIAKWTLAAAGIILVLECAAQVLTHKKEGRWIFLPEPQMFVPDDTFGYRLARGQITPAFYVNALGFPGPDFPLEKSPGVTRIILWGESPTMGDANQGSDYSIAANLERYLRAAGDSTAEVVNGGVAGWTTHHQLKRLDDMLALRPDLVCLGFTWTDFSVGGQMGKSWKPGLKMGMGTGADFDNPMRKLKNLIFRRSAIVRYLRSIYTFNLPRIRKNYLEPYEYAIANPELWDSCADNQRKILAELKRRKIRTALISFPYIVPQGKLAEYLPHLLDHKGYGDNKNWYEIYLRVQTKAFELQTELARSEGVPLLDVARRFETLQPEDRIAMFEDMFHFTRKGTEEFARNLKLEMEEKGILPLPRR